VPYQNLEPGGRTTEHIPLRVAAGRRTGDALIGERTAPSPTIEGVDVTQAQAFVNERRVLVVSYNSAEPPGTLGYTVVVRTDCSVGDHYHHRREERIVLLHGQAEFRLVDERPGSPTRDVSNVFHVDYPGITVRIPTGVAHTIIARHGIAILQVLASADYDPTDDVHVAPSRCEVSGP
jgi:dTDP-4-dehydrorhamnose 3,5-epimerase-like enzyme